MRKMIPIKLFLSCIILSSASLAYATPLEEEYSKHLQTCKDKCLDGLAHLGAQACHIGGSTLDFTSYLVDGLGNKCLGMGCTNLITDRIKFRLGIIERAGPSEQTIKFLCTGIALKAIGQKVAPLAAATHKMAKRLEDGIQQRAEARSRNLASSVRAD